MTVGVFCALCQFSQKTRVICAVWSFLQLVNNMDSMKKIARTIKKCILAIGAQNRLPTDRRVTFTGYISECLLVGDQPQLAGWYLKSEIQRTSQVRWSRQPMLADNMKQVKEWQTVGNMPVPLPIGHLRIRRYTNWRNYCTRVCYHIQNIQLDQFMLRHWYFTIFTRQ